MGRGRGPTDAPAPEPPGCWGWGLVFWTLAWGRVVWSLVDLGLDAAYLADVVWGAEFGGHSSATAVRTAATTIFVFDVLLVFTVESYLIIVKRRFANRGWLKEPGYLYNISWYEFKALVAVTFLEDVPQLVILVWVSNVTSTFGVVTQLQLATGVLSSVYFLAQAARNFWLYRRGYRLMRLDLASRHKELRRDAAADLRKGKVKAAAKKGVAAIKEPKRAKKAQREFDERDAEIRNNMKVVVK